MERSRCPILVLSRKLSQKIIFGNGEIVIQIVEVRGDKVRIGITAPDNMPIHREEVFEAIKREGKEVKSAAKLTS